MLFRDSASVPELLLLRRPEHVSFGGAWVFPGGGVEADDRHTGFAELCGADPEQRARQRLSADADGLCWWIAAVRELFEETGIALFRHASPGAELNDARHALLAGDVSFSDLSMANNWTFNLERLNYHSYWVAPDWVSPRYATRFFVARLPEGQDCQTDGEESLEHRWLQPDEALAGQDALKLPRPTAENIASVACYKTMDELLQGTADGQPAPVMWPRQVDGELVLEADLAQLKNLSVRLPGTKSD